MSALFGAAGLALVNATVTETARSTAISLKKEAVALELAADGDFNKSVQDQMLKQFSGLVVAFDKESGCPNGWTEFESARGRTIIGVGHAANLSARTFQALGGEEQVRLSKEQMPNHSHDLDHSGTDAAINGSRGSQWGVRTNNSSTGFTVTAGGGSLSD